MTGFKMKFFITLLSIIIFSSFSFSQTPISKGTLSLNGNLSFSSQTYKDFNDNRNVLTLNPQIGYFLFPNFSLGASFQYNRTSNSNSSTTNWGIGPSFRYYFNSKNIIPFLSLGYLYAESKISFNNLTTTGHSFIFSGGLDYFITKNVAMETVVSYSINNKRLSDSYSAFVQSSVLKSHTFNIGIGINLFLQ